ncbi:MAG: TIGR02679 domain-containing protein [Propionibacteriaceae bacterium]|nr:TIGR02679 domain-containing protein [Propionibacteriaceae bacterium]
MIPTFVLEWAKQTGPAIVLQVARQRLETGRLGARGSIDTPLDAEQRRQVGEMLEAAWTAGTAPVSVAKLRAGLVSHGVELEDLLAAIGGPLRDLKAERHAENLRRADDAGQALTLLRALDSRVSDEVITRCLTGGMKGKRAEQITAVVESAREGEQLPVLAARLFGDAQALDRSRPLGRAVARFLAGTIEGAWRDPVVDSATWREAWAAGGVVCDGVSTHVLVLNLPLIGDAPAVQLSALRGEPVWLTLRSLRGELRLAEGVTDVFVCENPSIVEAAADRFGAASRPLVCTFGVPSQAALDLLRAVGGARLHVRADEDPAGRRIVARLLRLPDATPWRMGEETRYEEQLLEDLLVDLALPPGD